MKSITQNKKFYYNHIIIIKLPKLEIKYLIIAPFNNRSNFHFIDDELFIVIDYIANSQTAISMSFQGL